MISREKVGEEVVEEGKKTKEKRRSFYFRMENKDCRHAKNISKKEVSCFVPFLSGGSELWFVFPLYNTIRFEK